MTNQSARIELPIGNRQSAIGNGLRPSQVRIERELEVVGRLPWLGDLFGAWWKPNIRNLNLLRRRATVSAEQAKQGRASDWLFVGLIIVTLLSLLFACIAFTGFLFWYLFRNFSVVG